MRKRCPFIVGAMCCGAECACWRESASGDGYCGVGGAPLAASNPSDAQQPAAVAIHADKSTTNGVAAGRTRRS